MPRVALTVIIVELTYLDTTDVVGLGHIDGDTTIDEHLLIVVNRGGIALDRIHACHFRFIQNNTEDDERFWTHSIDTPAHNAWCGLAFERVCFAHIDQIRRALGIEGIASNVYAWRVEDDPELGPGAQIDMLIDRADQVVNICEMKFSSGEYRMDKEEALKLQNKKRRFAEATQNRKALHLTMISTYGMVHNAYWNDIQKEVTADDLFL